MVDILKMGSSNLASIQHALTTTGHNIANVNTEGYSRQTVNFETAGYQQLGFGFVGSGSRIESVERSYDSFLTSQVRDFSSSESKYETFVNFSSRVDDILANSDTSLSSSLQKFFSAVQDVAGNPSSLPERQVLIGEANNLIDRQQNFRAVLQGLNDEVNTSLSNITIEVNGLADSIASLNKQIVSAASAGNGSAPNDLLDQRDILIKELAKKISVSTTEQGNGAVNVFIGKGQSLVVGSQVTKLVTQTNPYDSSRLELAIEGNGNINSVSEFVRGGELEGLLDFRSRVLLPAQMQLGLVTLGLTETVNAQHQLGMDLNGDAGADIFTSAPINVAQHTNNSGNAAPTVTLDDATAVRASDYLLAFNGSQWQLTRTSDNTSVSGTGTLVLDGMSVDVSVGTATTGDSFTINPAKDSAMNFDLNITDPRKIAAASLVQSETPLTNTGTATLSDLSIAETNTLPLAADITITFNPDALGSGLPGFDVSGGVTATIAYDPATAGAGQTITLASAGISFKIANTPQTGDSFVVKNNTGSFGDNSNILQMGELQHQSLLNGGTATYQEFYGSMVAQVGVNQRQAEANLSVETVLRQQAEQYRDSVSGVNLDEEAANLLRYQQAYQSAAKLIQVADELFQTLINSIR